MLFFLLYNVSSFPPPPPPTPTPLPLITMLTVRNEKCTKESMLHKLFGTWYDVVVVLSALQCVHRPPLSSVTMLIVRN